jgi:lipopolysaccharide transport system ATP-binding protein
LKDVSFEVKRGEVVGIIGRNGAGKSTLLKILSRITEPSEGRVTLRGRVASLLEVGTGFHPELTGRENIFLNGAILGMTKAEIRKKFDEIVAFAEVERFLDTPVKRYSSGMYVRLAFAVAAHLEPEILVVDEVLAVGDAEFQKKCLGKMKDVATGGRTVLFVSHNMTAVRNLCSKAIWLDKGRVVEVGEVYPVTQHYIEKSRCSSLGNGGHPSWANGEFRLIEAEVLPTSGQGHEIRIDEDNTLMIRFEVLRPQSRANLSVLVFSDEGVCAFNTYTVAQAFAPGTYKASCKLPAHLFNDSVYQIGIMFVERETPSLNIPLALQVEFSEVRRKGTEWLGKFPGILRPELTWKTEAT